eukprot:4976610-Heterocapsa_arctica.AAC.1
MPPAIAFRDEKYVDDRGKVIIGLEHASRKMSKLFRHQSNRIQPFNDGGWFLCSEIFDLTHDKNTSLFPDQRNAQFLYNLMVHNEKQRFQPAVHTVDSGKDRRCVTDIYAIRCTSGN